jgi:hypothetical protein
MKNKKQIEDIGVKLLKGLKLTHRNLIKEKKKNDGTLVFYKDGKIVKIKAKNLPA